ncbi:MAG: hypothetical protein ACYSVY_02825 [Planctomycetota bacterium]|jgi:hypothetical protein
MKSYAAFVLIVLLIGFGAWWYTSQTTGDAGYLIGLAFGNETDEIIDLHLVVSMRMSKIDAPKLKFVNEVSLLDWESWVEDHFQLLDPQSQPVPLRRTQNSNLMKGARRLGTPDFYLAAQLRPGLSYTLDYIPIVAKGKRYRHILTAPAEYTTFQRVAFEPVEPG